MPPERRFDFAVIGGGISGLVAARDLALAGASIVLLEADEQLGGRVRSASLAGAQIDVGAESFATRGGAVAALIAELGLTGDVRTPEPLGAWVVLQSTAARGAQGAGSQPHAVPLPGAGALGIPAAPLSRATRRALGLPGALRAAVEPMLPRRIGADAITLADLVRARLGERALDRLVRPVTLGVYSTEPADISVAGASARNPAIRRLLEAFAQSGSLVSAAATLRGDTRAAGSAAASLSGGMRSLVGALSTELSCLGVEARTRRSVTALEASGERSDERSGARWIVRTAAASGSDSVPAADHQVAFDVGSVILATGARDAARLLHEQGESWARFAPQDPESIEIVALALDTPALDAAPRGTGALVPPVTTAGDTDPIRAKAVTHVTAKWRDRASELPPGRHVLRLSYGHSGAAPATAGLSDAAARELALHDAALILGIALQADDVVDAVRQEWRVERHETDAPIPPPGIHLTGDWVHGTGLAAVVPGARQVAAHALQGKQHPPRLPRTATLEGSTRS